MNCGRCHGMLEQNDVAGSMNLAIQKRSEKNMHADQIMATP